MSRTYVRLSCPRPGDPRALILAASMAILVAFTGCTGGDIDTVRELDSTLARVDRLLDDGKVLEARSELLVNLGRSSGAWKGIQAAGAYRLLGDLSRQTAQLDSAMLFYARAEEAYRGRVQHDEAFRMSLAVVDIHRLMQREEDAHLQALEALRLATLFGDSTAVQEIRWSLLDVYRTLEQPEEIARTAAALRAFCRRSSDYAGEARIDLMVARGEAQRGETDAAIGSLLQSITLAGKARDSVLVVRGLLSLAAAFEKAGRMREAQESYATILQQGSGSARDPEQYVQTLLRIGNFSLRSRRVDTAAAYFQRASAYARTVFNATGEAYALLQEAHCLGSRKRTEAEVLFRKGYELLRAGGHARGTTYALISLGRAAEMENRITDALQLYSEALKAQESAYASRTPDDLWLDCEETVLGRGGADAYRAMVSLLLQTGKTEEAFWYQERCNARALADDLASWDVETGTPATDSTLRIFTHLRALHKGAEGILEQLTTSRYGTPALVTKVRADLSHLEEDMGAQADRIRHADARMTAIVDPGGVSVADIQKALDPDALLLMYLPTERSLNVCAVTPSHSTLHMSSTAPERIAELMQWYLQECMQSAGKADSARENGRGRDGYMRELTRALYEALILPVESEFRHDTRLVVILPSRLPAFSLAGLRRGGRSGAPALVERFALSYLPSARFLLSPAAASVPVRTVTALGVRGSTGWDVEYELRDIHAFYRDARLLFGKEATLASLRSTRSDLLHLAAEVRFSRQHPLRGAFILGDGENADGSVAVPLASVFSLPPARAVVLFNLSNRLPATERAVAAAFLANGSSSVIVNAAPLTRKAKKKFGESFYTALQTGVMVPESFHAAQNAMVSTDELSSTFFWAPLMLWGKGNGGGAGAP